MHQLSYKISTAYKVTGAVLLSLLALSACASVNSSSDYMPALRTSFNISSHNELSSIISRSLNLDTVMLASQAFKKTDTLFIERRRLLGNDYGKPEVFQLLTNQNSCVLYHQQTKTYYPLKKTQCKKNR